MEEKLRKLMKHEGLNSTRLAEILGIQASGISHIMSGRNKPSYDFLLKLLQRFPQLNPDWLLLDKGPMYRGDIKTKFSAVQAVGEAPHVSTSGLLNAASNHGLFAPDLNEARDDKSIIPAETELITSNLPVGHSGFKASSSIERIVVFYKDKTFSEYKPE